jgi:phosphoenolpyruvate-protein phosphotransferase (PTS system enzyme I)
MVFALTGIAVSDGITIGQAYLLNHAPLRTQRETLEHQHDVAHEIMRFHRALETAVQQLKDIRLRVANHVPHEVTAFLDTHLMMLHDDTVIEAPTRLIQTQRCNAEWAICQQRDAWMQAFDDMEDHYLRSRRDDVKQIVERILRALRAHQDPAPTQTNVKSQNPIMVATDMNPADLLLHYHEGIAGLITELGGPLSHTAILARNLGIPTLVGVKHATHYLRQHELIVLDCANHTVWQGADAAATQHFRHRIDHHAQQKQQQRQYRHLPTCTQDHIPIELHANVEFTDEISPALEQGAAGVGLYRTEFLVLDRGAPPTEDQQFEEYRRAIATLAGKPLVLRTFDLGADKATRQSHGGTNPALGMRGIRYCLSNVDLFLPQLRAALRASAFGPLRLMIPMVTHAREMQQVRQLVNQCAAQLDKQGIAFDRQLAIGAMIEVPAAAMALDTLAPQCDFISIGTNDLMQYMLAIDRMADEVNYLYDPLHPGFLTILHHIISTARKHTLPVSMCGEMAGDARYTKLLIGMGLRQFSMNATALPTVKHAVLSSDTAALAKNVRNILHASSHPEEAKHLLAGL